MDVRLRRPLDRDARTGSSGIVLRASLAGCAVRHSSRGTRVAARGALAADPSCAPWAAAAPRSSRIIVKTQQLRDDTIVVRKESQPAVARADLLAREAEERRSRGAE